MSYRNAHELRARKVELKRSIDAIVASRLNAINAEWQRIGRKPADCGLRADERETVHAAQEEIRAIEDELRRLERR